MEAYEKHGRIYWRATTAERLAYETQMKSQGYARKEYKNPVTGRKTYYFEREGKINSSQKTQHETDSEINSGREISPPLKDNSKLEG